MTRIFPDIYGDFIDYSILDPVVELGEIFQKAQELSPQPDEKTDSQWQKVFRCLEASLSNGLVWETEQQDFQPSPQLEKSFYDIALYHLDSQGPQRSLEEIMEDFDKWVGTPVDILTPYGDIDFGNNIFAGDFALDVPVKIYSEQDNYVLTADVPWFKIDSFSDLDVYTEKLNLKSVLSSLPININSQNVRASFENGEFRIELPREDTVEQKKIL